MASLYLAADTQGWYRPQYRTDLAIRCAELVGSSAMIEWPSSMSDIQRTHLTSQWLNEPDGPLYDEWIPDEWLLRAYTEPAMAAIDFKHGVPDARLFEIEAKPVVLGRATSVTIPELGLVGVREFRVQREVPGWWLYGPNGHAVAGLHRQYHHSDVARIVAAASPERQEAWRELAPQGFLNDVLAIADATRRVGAVTLASSVARDIPRHGQLAADRAYQAAVGLIVHDVVPEACVLYRPWLDVFGTPTVVGNPALTGTSYPAPAELSR